MNRLLAALAVLVAAAAAAPAEDKPQLKVLWHGQSFFEIVSSQGTRVVLDPHGIESYGRIQVPQADLILMSHLHSDHTQVDVVDNYKKVTTYNALRDVKGDGRRIEFVPVNDSVKDVKFHDVSSFHDNAEGMIRGRNGIWVLEVDGLRIVHLGDLGHMLTDEEIKAIGAPVDVLMVPVGGVYTLNGTDAKKVIEQLHPRRYVLPMHYGIPKIYEDLLPLDEFLDGLKPQVVKRYDINELTIDPSSEPPAEPLIAILNWKKGA